MRRDITESFAENLGLGVGVQTLVGFSLPAKVQGVAAVVVARAFALPRLGAHCVLEYFGEQIIHTEGIGENVEAEVSEWAEDLGAYPRSSAIVGCASGAWQDARGRNACSFDMLRARGWVNIHAPQPGTRNPPIRKRLENDARLVASENAMVTIHPEPCPILFESTVQEFEKEAGFPNRNESHVAAYLAMSYLNWRCSRGLRDMELEANG